MPSEAKWSISFLAGAILLFVGWKVYFVLVTLHVLICLILISVILLQSGEAADLAGAWRIGQPDGVSGPRGAVTFLSRATTWCAVMFMFTSMALAVHIETDHGDWRALRYWSSFSKPASTKPAARVNPQRRFRFSRRNRRCRLLLRLCQLRRLLRHR